MSTRWPVVLALVGWLLLGAMSRAASTQGEESTAGDSRLPSRASELHRAGGRDRVPENLPGARKDDGRRVRRRAASTSCRSCSPDCAAADGAAIRFPASRVLGSEHQGAGQSAALDEDGRSAVVHARRHDGGRQQRNVSERDDEGRLRGGQGEGNARGADQDRRLHHLPGARAVPMETTERSTLKPGEAVYGLVDMWQDHSLAAELWHQTHLNTPPRAGRGGAPAPVTPKPLVGAQRAQLSVGGQGWHEVSPAAARRSARSR